jgi:hypothetical protein
MAMADAGFRVEVVCPSRHPVTLTGAAQRVHRYHGLRPLSSFEKAIEATRPDLIVPGDDLATRHLHQIHRNSAAREKGVAIRALIESSLGDPSSFPVVFERARLMGVARELGVLGPATRIINDTNDLLEWVSNRPFPIVLKANGTSGGEGVRIVFAEGEAKRAFRKLAAPPLLARALKRSLLDRDSALLRPSLLRRRSVVNAQAYAPGREATSAVACWNGAVVASLQFEVLEKAKSAGHATVIRVIENPHMANAAEQLVRKLKLSGLHGFDFMLEAESEKAHLIEINPRATQVGHLTLGLGRDLPAALYAMVTGQPVKPAPNVTENDTIALFPQEWIRDTASPFLQSAYHDVPWRAPELVRACVANRRKHSAWYAPSTKPKSSEEPQFPARAYSGDKPALTKPAAFPSERGLSNGSRFPLAELHGTRGERG